MTNNKRTPNTLDEQRTAHKSMNDLFDPVLALKQIHKKTDLFHRHVLAFDFDCHHKMGKAFTYLSHKLFFNFLFYSSPYELVDGEGYGCRSPHARLVGQDSVSYRCNHSFKMLLKD